jgi:rhodanese-related sulfurtransferase
MTTEQAGPKTVKDMVSDARARIENLSPEQVQEELKQGALLVDIRESDEREQHGVIPGAVHHPRGMLEFWADPTSPFHREDFDPNRRIILHCMAGGRSSLAADTLQNLGYKRVAHMDGGFERWHQEGRPVEGGHEG